MWRPEVYGGTRKTTAVIHSDRITDTKRLYMKPVSISQAPIGLGIDPPDVNPNSTTLPRHL